MRVLTERDLKRLEERRELADKAAAHLYAHGAQNVWLFGSIARGRLQDERSDIDLAVEGLPPKLHFRMVGDLMDLTGCSVDLVELETAPPGLREQIEKFRVMLPHEN